MQLDTSPSRPSRSTPDTFPRVTTAMGLRTEPAYTAPDKTAWQARHGAAPYLLDVPHTHPALVQAARIVEEDFATLDNAAAVRLRTRMDELCESIAAEFMDEADAANAQVFYDPNTTAFYAYPQ